MNANNYSDRFLEDTDDLLQSIGKKTDGFKIGTIDFFPLLAYAIADRQASFRHERQSFARLRGAVVPLVSRAASSIGMHETIRIPNLRAPADILLISGYHRTDMIGNTDLPMPTGPLELALMELDLATVRLSYHRPKDEGPADISIVKGWSVSGGENKISREALHRWEGTKPCLRVLARGIPAPDSLQIEFLARLLRLTWSAERAFRCLLAGTAPKSVVVCGGINPFTAGCVLAARALDINVIELQHGQLRRFDPRLTGLNVKHSVAAPIFLSWLPMVGARRAIFEVGTPYDILRCLCSDSTQMPICKNLHSMDRKIRSKLDALDRPIGLVTLQPGLRIDADVRRVAAEQGIKTLLWRRHPRMHSISYNEHDELATATPLGILLPHIDLHITHSSASAFEAFGAGVRTVFLSDLGLAMLPDCKNKRSRGLKEKKAFLSHLAKIVS